MIRLKLAGADKLGKKYVFTCSLCTFRTTGRLSSAHVRHLIGLHGAIFCHPRQDARKAAR